MNPSLDWRSRARNVWVNGWRGRQFLPQLQSGANSPGTFAGIGKPFGLELYRGGKTASPKPLPSPTVAVPEDTRPDDTTAIPRPSCYYDRRQNQLSEHFRGERRQAQHSAQAAPPLAPGEPDLLPASIDKSQLPIAEPKCLRDKAHLKFVASYRVWFADDNLQIHITFALLNQGRSE